MSDDDRKTVSQNPSVKQVVEALCASEVGGWSRSDWSDPRGLPSREKLIRFVDLIKTVLFPGYFGNTNISRDSLKYHVGAALDEAMQILQEQITHGQCFLSCRESLACSAGVLADCSDCRARGTAMATAFMETLPELRRLLHIDVQAAFEGDPALHTPDEAIFCYPGLQAIISQRIAHELFVLGAPLIPRIITELAHSLTGIDIHPGAAIGERFFIDHGTGVVIGETCVIGRNVRIYQGVTLGAKSFPLDSNGNPIKGVPRHPIVEDDVVIYSGATILGRITIGRGAVIGGNVWVTSDVPAGSLVSQKR
ncbi:MAG TPA: serine acetyltransferase [Myxococcota bacterium]|nr:serine acetyltransferase [Myxococcota bacterium]HPB51312.1 serine acetyltransferase [Myxococcota bacterium]HQP96105.1 serine acetyltransferase [Myxococcota bacterium]